MYYEATIISERLGYNGYVSKKHKKRRKLTRRQRQQQPVPAATEAAASDQPKADTLPQSTASTADQPKIDTPAAEPTAPDAPPTNPPAAATADTVRFAVDTKRNQSGLDQSIAEREIPTVRRDLRKLGFSVIVLGLVLAGLTALADQTTVISNLGEQLFRLWQ